MIDWDATVAWVAFGVAIITPAITTYLNNNFQLKVKKLELRQSELNEYYSKKKEQYAKYLETASFIILLNTYVEDTAKYKTQYHGMFLYCPSELFQKLEDFDNMVNSNKCDEKSRLLLLDITKFLSEDLKKSEP